MEPAGQRSDRSPRRTDKAAEADSERHRTRERLEATLAGLGELDYLRQRQEALVRAVLGSAEPTPRAESGRSLEEKLLEDNISLLKRQLNCLRKRDAGLLSQLHELDKQINDLRLDTEKPTEEPHDPDSRPSSGFYELSDGTSGSLSNSSNSVFSECLSSCQSSTCLGGGGGPLDASLNLTDGPPKLTDDFLEWLDCRDGQSELTGTIRRSFCIDHSSSAEAVNDVNPKYQCDLVSKNGSDIYRYPSPLHAVAVQSPMFILSVMGNLKEAQETDCNAAAGCIVPEPTVIKPEGPLLPAGRACPASLPTTRKLDGYILSIIQKKSQPVRTNKPRTSVNADPVKGILRHGSLCIKQPGTATAQSAASNPKNSKQSCLHSSAITSPENGTGLPPKQGSKESPDQQLETKRLPPTPGSSPGNPDEGQNTLRLTVMLTGQGFGKNPPAVTSTALKDINTPTSAPHSSCDGTLKESVPLPKEMNISATKRVSPKTTGSSCHSSSFDERPSLDFKSEGSSSQSLDEGLLVNAHYIPAQQPAVRLHRVTKNVKIVKSSTLKHRVHVQHAAENCSPTLKEKGKVTGKKCRFPEDLDPNKRIKRISQRARKPLHSSGDSVGVKNPGTARPGSRGHGHAKDVVVAKPKHKRGDYRRWKSSAEISYEEALRRARRKSQREVVGVFAQVPLPYASPYAYIASDSEYSAECESLFHSTVVDTSEDEQSNYTTNCFGDSESSLSEVEFVGESTTSTSDTDESGGLIWSQFVHTLPAPAAAELHATAKAFVKIKASHNLKKKILRFRSGSLKLMTTV